MEPQLEQLTIGKPTFGYQSAGSQSMDLQSNKPKRFTKQRGATCELHLVQIVEKQFTLNNFTIKPRLLGLYMKCSR